MGDAGDADDTGDDEDPVSPENLCTNFFSINPAAPECGFGCANSADARGMPSVIGMGGWRLPSGVGVAPYTIWISLY